MSKMLTPTHNEAAPIVSNSDATKNQRRLRANLAAYGWSQKRLADWLTELGEPVTRKQVEGWLANPDSTNYRHCPAWPALLIEARDGKSVKNIWSKSDDQFLLDHYPSQGADYCADHLARTRAAVYTRANCLGLRASNTWHPDQDSQLRKLHAHGLFIRDVADEMGVSQKTIINHAKRLGLKFSGTGRHLKKRPFNK